MIKTIPLPTQEQLRYLFYYNPETGIMYARIPSGKRKIGGRGTINSAGYRQWAIDKTLYLEHRLIWMYMTGEDPKQLNVDHEDRDKSNNKWSNLRLGTPSQNHQNKLKKGYTYHKQRGKFQVRITVDGKSKSCGLFATEEEARNAYIEAKNNYHGDFSPYLA